ncbi:MAG: phenylalanine--tRNA ligase subunit beta [Bacteroidota bacterium]
MKISINWLKDFIDIKQTPESLDHLLTMSGLEVEGIEKFEPVKGGLAGVVIGEVMSCEKHPNAEKLSITRVNVGNDKPLLPIVCGAPNVAAGQKVLVATVGTTLYFADGGTLKIKRAKIRGEISEGMICAEDELGLGDNHDGIMVLDTNLSSGTPATEYLEIETDYVLDIGLTPNRADAASHYGVARDLKVLLGNPLKKYGNEELIVNSKDLSIEVVVENTEACPRYSGITISGMQIQPSPKWLQNRLKAIGINPINNVVDATNYILHSYGQPLHAFDAEKIKGNKIIVKTLPEGTSFVSLDEKERKLAASDLMICDISDPMCIGGIFGGLHSGVTQETTSIFLESAYFNPGYIRKSAQYHVLKTDASFRFERGTDPNATVKVLKIAANLIKDLAGGYISSEIVDVYPEPIQHFEVAVSYKNLNRLIGKEIDKSHVKAILNGLEIDIVNESENGFTVKVPPYRVDVQREADIIEEVLRMYGYDNVDISENLNSDYLANFPEKDAGLFRSNISQMLAGSGFQEIMTNSLTNSDYTSYLESLSGDHHVTMLNALSEDLDVMRQTMVFSVLEVVAHNINRKQTNLKLFEFGKTYIKNEDKYHEKALLTLAITGMDFPETWQVKQRKSSFHQLSGIVIRILTRFNFTELETAYVENEAYSFSLSYQHKKHTIGSIGLLKPYIAKKFGISQGVYYAELDWKYIIKHYNPSFQYKEIPKFPEVNMPFR